MSETRRSLTFTVLIFVGMLIALGGLFIVLLGLGGATTFEFAIGDVKVKTTSAGLAVLAVGAALSAGVALNLPEGVEVFGRSKRSLAERLKVLAPALLIVSAVAVVVLIVSLVV